MENSTKTLKYVKYLTGILKHLNVALRNSFPGFVNSSVFLLKNAILFIFTVNPLRKNC